MLTRASVLCAERIVAARSSNGFVCCNSHNASGYATASLAATSRVRPLALRGRFLCPTAGWPTLGSPRRGCEFPASMRAKARGTLLQCD